MEKIKNEKGYMLVEIVIVFSLMSFIILFIANTYLLAYKTYIGTERKAENLEEARLVINQIEEEFRCLAYGTCTIVKENNFILKDGEGAEVKKIVFNFPKQANIEKKNTITITYNKSKKLLAKQNNEIASNISKFYVKKDGDFLDFIVEVSRDGNRGLKNQIIEFGTRINLKYTGIS